MSDPSIRQLLELARPVREFSQAIQTAFRLVETAVSAEGQIDNLKERAAAATRDLQALEARKSGLAGEIAKEREILLGPARIELAKLEGEAQVLRHTISGEKQAFDEERGRRTSILRTLEDQAGAAQRAQKELIRGLQADAEVEKARIRGDIEELKAKTALAREELERTRQEYSQVLDAAANLVRRAG